MEKIKIYSNPAAGGASVQSDDGDAISLPEVVVIGSYPRGSWWDSCALPRITTARTSRRRRLTTRR